MEQNPYAHCGELKQLSYLDEETSKQYCKDLIYAETFAKINHHMIAYCICNEMKWDKIDWVPTELGNENYIGIIAEEQFGKYEVPEFFTENLLTDEVLLGYIQGKYGEHAAIQVAQILRKG